MSDAFARNILNYFAAYTETRFQAGKNLLYRWSDDIQTLNLSVYPRFEAEVMEKVSLLQPFEFRVQKGDHTITLDAEETRKAILDACATFLTSEALAERFSETRKRIEEAGVEMEVDELESRAMNETLRNCSLDLREAFISTLVEQQDRVVQDLRKQYRFEHPPASTLNARIPAKEFYDNLQDLIADAESLDAYGDSVRELVGKLEADYVLYDLYLNLRNYFTNAVGQHSTHLFLHEIRENDGQGFPLFSLEVIGAEDGDAYQIRTSRDWVMLNTPAVNAYEFKQVLTTPRASRMNEAQSQLVAMERFLQSAYTLQNDFLFSTHYPALVEDGLPTIRFRLGLQAVEEADRKLLDYSELMTSLDEGGGHKFSNLLDRYLDGNCTNTHHEVEQHMRERYPKGSSERLVPKHSQIPIPLNDAQRKILTAVENPKNEIMVIDGPPGTGKSYTITALVHHAAEHGKSVVITSHKQQALDVIDEALTEQVRKIHPQAKPAVLRLQKPRQTPSINNLRNTLTQQAVNAAHRRAGELNETAVEADRERSRSEVASTYERFHQNAKSARERQQTLQQWWEHLLRLFPNHEVSEQYLPSVWPVEITLPSEFWERLSTLVFPEGWNRMTLEELRSLQTQSAGLPEARAACERIHEVLGDNDVCLETLLQDIPEGSTNLLTLLEKLRTVFREDVPLCELEYQPFDPSNPEKTLPPEPAVLVEALALLETWKEDASGMGTLFRKRRLKEHQTSLAKLLPKAAPALDTKQVPEFISSLTAKQNKLEQLRKQHPGLRDESLIHGVAAPAELKDSLTQLRSLAMAPLLDGIDKEWKSLTLGGAVQALQEKLQFTGVARDARKVSDWAETLGWSTEDLVGLFQRLRQTEAFLSVFEEGDLDRLQAVRDHFAPLFAALEADAEDLVSLHRFLQRNEKSQLFREFAALHVRLSNLPEAPPPDIQALADYFEKNRKLNCRLIDQRFAGLLSNSGDMARILTAMEAGKRLSTEQSRVLLGHLSCIIAEAPLISKHLPMEQDLIDLLIIDEASQVSIADSISLMLRAKQTIVFGDELQYGAVGAFNVKRVYSEAYFHDVLDAYATRSQQSIPEEEMRRLSKEANESVGEDEETSSQVLPVDPGTLEWLKTFSVRTSTLAFAKALQNYSASLNTHFRCYPEIISYSNDYFYKRSQIELIPNRIRNKPIGEVLRFLKVDTQGLAGDNVNLDEIEAIQADIEQRIAAGYPGTIGIICSFKQQTQRMAEELRKMEIFPKLERDHNFRIWFVGDVQGEERDTIYYSFVQDKKIGNADLRQIYPTIGGTADDIRKLKMQRLNVGFSRAKDTMVFVHSMEIGEYSDTRLGEALRHYKDLAEQTHDHYVEDESIFDSPAERQLYQQITQTSFFQENRDRIRLIAQFAIGNYIRREFQKYIPAYRVDFLLTFTPESGREQSLILEYDGLEFHTKNPDIVNARNFDQEYLEYDIERQVELEGYGYRFLRIHKFSLLPTPEEPTPVDVLDRKLREALQYSSS